MTSLLIIAVLGQSYVAQRQVLCQPVQYQQQPYVQQETKFVPLPMEDAQVYYQGIVGASYRAEQRQTQAQQATASTDARIEQLTRAIESLQKRLETQASEPALPSHPGQTPAPPVPSFAPAASEAAPPPPTVRAAANRPGLALLASKCGACHTGNSQKGRGFAIFAADGSFAKLDRVSLENIDAEIAAGRMPKAASNLTLREYVTVRDFLAEQASGLALNINQRKKPL